MKDDECYYFTLQKGDLVENDNTACWAGMYQDYKEGDGCIYISNFRDEDTEKYITKLCAVLNKITPCKLVKIKEQEYIRFQLFKDSYNKNLLLLNFIRYLWYFPNISKRKERHNTFFRKLYTRLYSDPISILTFANKEACTNNNYSMGHSNLGEYKKLNVQTLESFNNFNWDNDRYGSQIRTFLYKII